MQAAIAETTAPVEAEQDKELAQRFRRGDAGAFEQLVAVYQPRVERLAHRLLGWRGDVEDVVQDVFYAALRQHRRFRGDCSLRTWLTTITLNACRLRHRRRMRWRWWREIVAADERPVHPADETVQADETSRRVREAVQLLPPPQREVIVLYYLEELSAVSVAEVLGLSISATNVRLHRARERLKELLADLNQD